MNFSIAAKGHSFKGAFAYYLHDKGAQTAERVAWAETRNLAHDDPAYAQSVMIATARQAEALKKAAGVKSTGRKAAGAVHAYSISWHPEKETIPGRAGMVAIANETLKLLKADHLQAVIVCHQDTAHPHVHVIVNRVDPGNGKMHPFGNDAHKLDEWAAKYERDRAQIVSPNRDEKHEERKRQAARASPKPAFAKSAAPAAANAAKPKSRAALLAELQAAQKARHKQEWDDLSAANKARREAIKAERVDFKGIAAQHRAETRPLWSRLGKEQAAERRAFLEREKRVSGIVRNAIDIVRNQQIRGVADDRGFLAMCFNYTVSKSARHAAFNERQQDAKAQLAGTIDAALIAKFDAVKGTRAGKFAEARTIYDAARAALIERQNGETAKVREAWRQIYAEREKAGPLPVWGRRAAANDSQAQAPGPINLAPPPPTRLIGSFRPSTSQEPQPVKSEFETSAKLAPANPPPPVPNVSATLSVPAPIPAPSGDLPPISKRVHRVPDVDRAVAKPSPSTIGPVAKEAFVQSPQTPPERDFWKQATPANSPPPQKSPARNFWKQNSEEITGQKQSPATKPDHDYKPRPRR